MPLSAQKLLIPMDLSQTDHLKAYGIAFWTLEKNINIEWLLNYRGGAFMMDYYGDIERECIFRGVTFEVTDAGGLAGIYGQIHEQNMDSVLLEKAPDVAVYSPPDKQPWDDAVTLALEYAEIEYDVVFDHEVLTGKLKDYDWLHLHHEDFTGQYGKFYRNYHNAQWYKQLEAELKPVYPAEWHENSTEWLTTSNIENIVNQFELKLFP